jgi:hypothetical protein
MRRSRESIRTVDSVLMFTTAGATSFAIWLNVEESWTGDGMAI